MPEPQTNFELTIEKLVYGGEGLGRADGRVVFTPYVLPGERVVVEPVSVKGSLLRARLREVLTAAEGRVEPHCPYFGRCGGCHYQHASYALQLEAKQAILLCRSRAQQLGPCACAELTTAFYNRIYIHQ